MINKYFVLQRAHEIGFSRLNSSVKEGPHIISW